MTSAQKTHSAPSSALLQLAVNFVIPLVILTQLSDESRLGPTKSFLLALAFPVAFELYSIVRRKKLSMLSVFSIGGILLTGAVSLLELSESWLAIRRSATFVVMGLIIGISMMVKRPVVEMLLPHILDMKSITAHAKARHTLPALRQMIVRSGYMLCILMGLLASSSYILTRVVITSDTNTPAFNQEYAALRLWSLAFVTLPLTVGIGGIIFYLLHTTHKLTGLSIDDLPKKKSK